MGVFRGVLATLAIASMGLSGAAPAASGVYACRLANGVTVIQDDPCPAGSTGKIFRPATKSATTTKPSHGRIGAGARAQPVRRTSSARTQIAVCNQLYKEKDFLDQARKGPDAAQAERDLKRIEKALCQQDCVSCPAG